MQARQGASRALLSSAGVSPPGRHLFQRFCWREQGAGEWSAGQHGTVSLHSVWRAVDPEQLCDIE